MSVSGAGKDVGGAVWAGTLIAIKYVTSLILIFILGRLAIFGFLTMFPEYEEKFDAVISQISKVFLPQKDADGNEIPSMFDQMMELTQSLKSGNNAMFTGSTSEQGMRTIDLQNVDPALIQQAMAAMGQPSQAIMATGNQPTGYSTNAPVTSAAIPGILPALTPMAIVFAQMEDKAKQVQYLSLLTPAKAGNDGRNAIPLLSNALRSDNTSLRQAAIQSLRNLDHPQAKATLIKAGL